jgi:RNase P protein component
MLPHARRLRAAEVRDIIANGKGVRAGAISLKYVEKQGVFRAAAVAPRSVAPRAADRNRMRRALYHVLATLPSAEAQSLRNTHGVFFIRSIPTPLTSTLREDITGIVRKIDHHV